MASRPLHFIWLVDGSGSMAEDGKIEAVNAAIREALPHMRKVADENPHARILMRAVRFSHGAKWHTTDATPVERFVWRDVVADEPPKRTVTADVVFLVDTSGSMGDEIEAVKRSCVAFADRIAKEGADARLGLVGFDIGGHHGRGENYRVHDLSKYTIGVWPLTAPAQFTRDVQSLSLGLFGGAGCYLANPDTVDIFPHVVRAFTGPREHRRILVIISDEMGGAEGVDEIVRTLRAASVQAHVLGVPGGSGAHERIAKGTGGRFWSIQATKGAHDFGNLLGNVAETIGKEVTRTLADGSVSHGTDMGAALRLVAKELRVPVLGERALPPVLVLVSDGQPTDDFRGGLKALMDEPWGVKAVRIAIAIGEDADDGVYQSFIDHPELKPLRANDPEALANHIKWASTVVLKAASAPASVATDGKHGGMNVPIPTSADVGSSRAAAKW